MAEVYDMDAADSTFPNRTFPNAQDDDLYSGGSSPERFDVRWFAKPIMDDILKHQDLLKNLPFPVTQAYSLTSDVTDLVLTNFTTRGRFLITPTADWIINGIAGGTAERTITLVNASPTFRIFLGPGGTVGNQMLLPVDWDSSSGEYVLEPYEAVSLFYYGTNWYQQAS